MNHRGQRSWRRIRCLSRLLPLACAGVAFSARAEAKQTGVHSAGGREIYGADEAFSEAMGQRGRHFVIEMVTGLAPEGNLGMLVGILNRPLDGLEFYGGLGFEATPATNYPFSARYWFDILGYRPFVSLGYSFRTMSELGIVSHNVFAEVGYKWMFHQTHHFTLGVGVRRPLVVLVTDDSVLHGPTIDDRLLEDERQRSLIFVPTLSVRFSRAF